MCRLMASALWFFIFAATDAYVCAAYGNPLMQVEGTVRDDVTSQPVTCRLYIKGADGRWYFPESSDAGEVVVYRRENYWDKSQVEMHATVAAKPFQLRLPVGEYTVIVERGKEYVPLETSLTVNGKQTRLDLRLKRWIDMTSRGWYSGDVHCHRAVSELANLMLAEDLNICFPITNWTT